MRRNSLTRQWIDRVQIGPYPKKISLLDAASGGVTFYVCLKLDDALVLFHRDVRKLSL